MRAHNVQRTILLIADTDERRIARPGSDREQHDREREGAGQEGERFAKQLHNLICRCEMAGPPGSEQDAARSAKRAGMAKYADSLLLYCSSRVGKTKSIMVDRLAVF